VHAAKVARGTGPYQPHLSNPDGAHSARESG